MKLARIQHALALLAFEREKGRARGSGVGKRKETREKEKEKKREREEEEVWSQLVENVKQLRRQQVHTYSLALSLIYPPL